MSENMGTGSAGVCVKNPFTYEQRMVDNKIMPLEGTTHSIIVEIETGTLRAWAPPDFMPEKQGVEDVIAAFAGDLEGLIERGLDLGCGTRVSVPGKMEDNAIFGNDGHQGGLSAFKTSKSVVFIVFDQDPTMANRIGMELADEMAKEGH